MNRVLIFLGGAVAGSAATLLGLHIIGKRREAQLDATEEEWKEVEIDLEEYRRKKEEQKEMDLKEIEEYNETASQYIEKQKEVPERTLEPWIMSDDDWKESPYERAYYTYFSMDNLLVDEHCQIVGDGRCGEDFVDTLEAEGVVHVCNEELETNFEITYKDDESYSEVLNKEQGWMGEDDFSEEDLM